MGILGTKYTMSNKVYPEKLKAVGIDYAVPDKPDQNRINAIIFDELVYGKFTKPALDYFTSVIDTLKTRGCDAAVLGCTEIPLLVAPPDSPLPTLDSTRLLARAAVERALEREQVAAP
jgi:aspartate racemase